MSRGKKVLQRLDKVNRRSDELSPGDFVTSAGSQGRQAVVAELTADSPVAISDGPIKLAVPAYESFESAGDGSEQTFSLSAGVTESPDTQDAVVWFGGSYEGVPAIDYDANEITVTGPGAVETVHVFHISPKPATVEIRKESPNGNHKEPLYEGNAALLHQTNQSEQPDVLRLNAGDRTPLKRFVATNMTLQVTVDAPYVVRFEDPDGDGASATNALLQIEAQRGDRTVPGLTALVTDAME